jgi:hypothetical protein
LSRLGRAIGFLAPLSENIAAQAVPDLNMIHNPGLDLGAKVIVVSRG